MGSRYNHLPCYKYVNVEAVSPVLEKSAGKPLRDYKVYGNSWQKEPPTPDNPQKIETLGDFDESTGKYKIPITVKSKNLLDYRTFKSRNQTAFPITINNNGSVNFKGNYYIQTDALMLGKGKTYVFNCDFECKDEIKPIWRILYVDGTYSTTAYTGKSITIDYTKTPKSVLLYVAMSETIYDIKYFNMQLTEGTKVQIYEPYINPYTYNISISEPLRKVGDYADYIDFENQKIVRKICEYKMQSNEFIEISASQSGITEGLIRYDGVAPSPNTTVSDCLCTHFPHLGQVVNKGYNMWLYSHSSSTRVAIRFVTHHQTLEEFRKWLAANDVGFIYVLETPTEESIELPAVKTNKYTNIFEIGTTLQPSNVAAQYYKKG